MSRGFGGWALGLALCASAGCAARVRRSCELEPGAVVTQNPGLGFDDVAVAARADGARVVFAWSDASGLWLKAESARPTRLGARCRGGIDVEVGADAAYVACSRSGEAEGEVVVYRIDGAGEVRPLGRVGAAGRDGSGVALAVAATPAGDALYLAFHDGSIGEHSVSLARRTREAWSVERLSPAGTAAAEPALVFHAGQLYAAFSQLELSPTREVESSLWIARGHGPASRVARVRVHAPAPKLTADARGLVLAYRDRARLARDDPGRSELYVARLDRDGRPAAAPQAIGRANAEGEPSVEGCGALTTALLPREYGGERFVGVNALDRELASVGAGHQFYATDRDFVLARAACVRGGWVLIAADRAAPGKPGVEALALRFHCAD